MKYYLNKIGVTFITLILISIIVFGVFQLLPGDPVKVMIGVEGDPNQEAMLRARFGLDRPVYEQYAMWATNFVQGDLGESMKYKLPVDSVLFQRIPVTLSLASLSLLITFFVGIPVGIWIASGSGRIARGIVSVITQIGVAMPAFWSGIILILIFGVILHLLPTNGYQSWSSNPAGWIKHMVLPAVTLAIANTCSIVRFMKNTLLDQMKMDYVRTALSKGLSRKKVIYKHVLRNTLIPVITMFGMITTDTLAGSMVTENVFALPGIGTLLVGSITSRDLPLIEAAIMYIAIIVTVVNFVIDVIYGIIDPRIRVK